MLGWFKRKKWKAVTFYIAGDFEGQQIKLCSGYAYKGIALHQLGDADCWNVTHLGTGHRLFGVYGNLEMAKEVAGELANATDWNFNKLPEKSSGVDERLRLIRKDIFEKYQPLTFISAVQGPRSQVAACAASVLNKVG